MKMTFLAAALTLLLGPAMITSADDKTADTKTPGTKTPATKPADNSAADNKPAINKFCAVEGGDHTVDPEFFVIYKGMKIGFCCKDCAKEFEFDADAYVAKLKARKDGIK